MKLKIFFFANFQILGPLGCQGWVVIPQNVKKVKITAPYCTYWRMEITKVSELKRTQCKNCTVTLKNNFVGFIYYFANTC